MRFQVILLFVIILGSTFIIPVKAAGVTITLEQDGTIQSRMVLSFHQNMTQLPTRTSTIDSNTDSSLMANFTKSLTQTQPSPKLSHVVIQVVSSADWLNATASMSLSGVSTFQGDIMNASTTWKAFHVDADLQADSLSYNTVGRRYIRPVYNYYVNASRFVSRPNAIITGVTFFSNQTSIGGLQAANQAGNLTLFDFRSLNATLDQWTYRYNLENNTSTWRFSPPPAIISSIKYSRGLNKTSTILMFCNYWFDSEILVTGLARSKGNNVLVDVGSGRSELVMTALVIVSIAAAVWIQVLYRRRRKKTILGRR
jgi:hypothetical protein